MTKRVASKRRPPVAFGSSVAFRPTRTRGRGSAKDLARHTRSAARDRESSDDVATRSSTATQPCPRREEPRDGRSGTLRDVVQGADHDRVWSCDFLVGSALRRYGGVRPLSRPRERDDRNERDERDERNERFGGSEHEEDGKHERVADVATGSCFAVRLGAESTGVLETADE